MKRGPPNDVVAPRLVGIDPTRQPEKRMGLLKAHAGGGGSCWTTSVSALIEPADDTRRK